MIERGEYISYRLIDISQIVTLYRIYRYHLADGRGKGGSMTSCEFDRRRRNDARRNPQPVDYLDDGVVRDLWICDIELSGGCQSRSMLIALSFTTSGLR